MTAESRRRFLKSSAVLTLLGSGVAGWGALRAAESSPPKSGLEGLKPMTDGATFISGAERKARRRKLRALLRKQGHGMALIEPGSTLEYFTGVKWWISERLTAAIIPAEGEMTFITPSFEESRLKEMLPGSAQIITW